MKLEARTKVKNVKFYENLQLNDLTLILSSLKRHVGKNTIKGSSFITTRLNLQGVFASPDNYWRSNLLLGLIKLFARPTELQTSYVCLELIALKNTINFGQEI